MLQTCECTCDVHKCQEFSPELLIWLGVLPLPLMDAASDSAVEVMVWSKQSQESPRGNWSCWVSLVDSVFSFCVCLWLFAQPSFFLRASLCSCFLLFLVLDEQWSRELTWFLLCSIVTSWGANGAAQLTTVVLLALERELVCPLPRSLSLAGQLCEACCGVTLVPVVMQSLSEHATTTWVP